MNDTNTVLADLAAVCDRDGVRRRRVARDMVQVRRMMLVALGVIVVSALFGALVYIHA